jgi:uncharacterized membrane protein
MKQPVVVNLPETLPLGSNSEELDPREITRDLERKIPSFNKVPQEDRVRAVGIIIQKVEMLSGPLPPPVVLEQYDNVMPGLANRIVAMAETTLAHDQEVQTKILDADIRASNRDHVYRSMGMVIALLALFGMLFLVAWLAHINKPYLAGLFSAVSIGVIIGKFIQGKIGNNILPPQLQNTASTKDKKTKKK